MSIQSVRNNTRNTRKLLEHYDAYNAGRAQAWRAYWMARARSAKEKGHLSIVKTYVRFARDSHHEFMRSVKVLTLPEYSFYTEVTA